MILTLKRTFYCVLVLCAFNSCRKASSANWDVDLVLPVTTSQLNISNFIGDSILKPDAGGLFHFVFNRELAALKIDSLLELPDTNVVINFTLPAVGDPTVVPGQVIPTGGATETKFDLPNDIQLKKIDVRKSVLHVKFTNSITQPLDLVFSIQSAKKNGKEFVIKETVPTGTYSLIKDYDLAGYSLDMSGLNGQKFNTIVQNASVSVNPSAGDAIVKYGQGLILEIDFTDVQPQLIEGYFGEQTIELPGDTSLLSIYKNFSANGFMLSDANIKFSVINEIGADFSGTINQLSSFNTVNRNNVVLNNNQLSRMNLNAAKRQNNTIEASTLAVTFNTLNSNVTAFISNLPDKLSYSGSVSINPLGSLVKNYNQFAYYNTGVRIWADIDIPVRFSANYFTLETESKMDLSNVDALNDFNYGNFVITAVNSFPFAVQLQAYLMNQNKQIIDSLLLPGQNTLQYGDVNGTNLVVKEKTSIINVGFDKKKIENLKLAKYVKLKTKVLLPPNPPDIQILERYKINVGIVAELNYNAKISR